VGHTIIFLPLGLLPIFFIVGFLFWNRAEEGAQKNIGSKLRQGITEFPIDISLMLCGENYNELKFTNGGKSVILTIASKNHGIDSVQAAKEYIRTRLSSHREDVNFDFANLLEIKNITYDSSTGFCNLTITLPDEVVRSEEYIKHEINNLGRVFVRNNGGNTIRHLWCIQGDRVVSKENDRIVVKIDRNQVVPGFLGGKTIVMSERQITRNIINRLWNRVSVRCLRIDEENYLGEIIL